MLLITLDESYLAYQLSHSSSKPNTGKQGNVFAKFFV